MADEAEAVAEPTLAEQINTFLNDFRPDKAIALIRNEYNLAAIVQDPTPTIAAIVKHMTLENFAQRTSLYGLCEDMLKAIANGASDSEVLIELLEVIDTARDDNIVVSVLKALQLSLLKQRDNRVRTLEWCLNSVQLYVSDLPLGKDVRQRLDSEEERLLEEEEEVRRILSFYFYLFLFYEPILERIIIERPDPIELYIPPQDDQQHQLAEQADQRQQADLPADVPADLPAGLPADLPADLPAEQQQVAENQPPPLFRERGITRTNVLLCFIIQLFNEPFAYLDMGTHSQIEGGREIVLTNTYTRQCVVKMVEHMAQLLPDPFALIHYLERRKRWPYILPVGDAIIDAPPVPDIFYIEEKAPAVGLSILFYALIAEGVMPAKAPKVYSHNYLFEMGLYMVTELLNTTEGALHYKGIRLGQKLIQNLGSNQLRDNTLDLDIHITFVNNLINVLTSTQIRRNSQNGVELLDMYIGKFETIEARHYHMQRLLRTVSNKKICGYVVTLYKNLVAKEIDASERDAQHKMTECCTGAEFRSMLMENICLLPQGIQTDLLQQSDLIIPALNFMRFFALRDRRNLTGFWDVLPDIERTFLKQLRGAIDHSRAHYNLEKRRIQENEEDDQGITLELNTLHSEYVTMNTENKLQVLSIGQNTFDLIECLMSQLTETIEAKKPQVAEADSTATAIVADAIVGAENNVDPGEGTSGTA